jgi:AcrR family transcriptional regulator
MTNSETMTRRTRAEIAAETREAILNAACEVIAEIGFENVRMRIVAERAGVSTAALHYHFDTRENLFAEALRYSFDHTGSDVYEARSGDDSATKRLARIISASLPTTESLHREWAMYQELWCRANRDPESRAVAIELDRAQQAWIEETLADGIAAGEFTPCDTAAHARLISSLCDGFGVQLMFGNPSLTTDSARAAIWAQAAGVLGISAEFPEDGR